MGINDGLAQLAEAPSVIGVAITGSFATGKQSHGSDLDLLVLTTNATERNPLLEAALRQIVNAIPVTCHVLEVHTLEQYILGADPFFINLLRSANTIRDDQKTLARLRTLITEESIDANLTQRTRNILEQHLLRASEEFQKISMHVRRVSFWQLTDTCYLFLLDRGAYPPPLDGIPGALETIGVPTCVTKRVARSLNYFAQQKHRSDEPLSEVIQNTANLKSVLALLRGLMTPNLRSYKPTLKLTQYPCLKCRNHLKELIPNQWYWCESCDLLFEHEEIIQDIRTEGTA